MKKHVNKSNYYFDDVTQQAILDYCASEDESADDNGGAGNIISIDDPFNNYGADAAWAQPAGMVDLKEDTVNATGLTLLYPEMNFDSSIAGAGGGDGGNAGEAAIIPSHFTVKKLSSRTSVQKGHETGQWKEVSMWHLKT